LLHADNSNSSGFIGPRRRTPVLAVAKYTLVINLKTAKTLSVNVPESLIARADEVIE